MARTIQLGGMLFVSLLFLLTGASKLRSRDSLILALPVLVPSLGSRRSVAVATATGLALVELAVGSTLLLGTGAAVTTALSITGVLTLVFVIAVRRAARFGVGCGCFGAAASRSARQSDAHRNLALLALVVVLLGMTFSREQSVVAEIDVAGLAVSGALAAAFFAHLRSAGAPRVHFGDRSARGDQPATKAVLPEGLADEALSESRSSRRAMLSAMGASVTAATASLMLPRSIANASPTRTSVSEDIANYAAGISSSLVDAAQLRALAARAGADLALPPLRRQAEVRGLSVPPEPAFGVQMTFPATPYGPGSSRTVVKFPLEGSDVLWWSPAGVEGVAQGMLILRSIGSILLTFGEGLIGDGVSFLQSASPGAAGLLLMDPAPFFESISLPPTTQSHTCDDCVVGSTQQCEGIAIGSILGCGGTAFACGLACAFTLVACPCAGPTAGGCAVVIGGAAGYCATTYNDCPGNCYPHLK